MKSATKVMVATLGTLAGLAGVEHGIGEALQGNVAPAGLAIVAWPGSEPFQVLSGEPAMTIVPSLLVTGILAILASLAYVLWATVLAGNFGSHSAGRALGALAGPALFAGGLLGSGLLTNAVAAAVLDGLALIVLLAWVHE